SSRPLKATSRGQPAGRIRFRPIRSHPKEHRMRSVFLIIPITLVLGYCALAASPVVNAEEAVKKADEGRMPDGEVTFVARVLDYDQKSLLRETRYRVSSQGESASLIETIAPERQKGRKLLMEGDSLWLYTPDIKRPARVSLQQRLTGEVSNG